MATTLMTFPKLYQPEKSQPKLEKTFLLFSSVAVGLFLEWAKCCSINSIHLNPALHTTVLHFSNVVMDRPESYLPRLHSTPVLLCGTIPGGILSCTSNRTASQSNGAVWSRTIVICTTKLDH